MSIKTKLSILLSLLITVFLTLDIFMIYLSSKEELQAGATRQMLTIARQIGTALEASEKSRKYMEDTVGERLRAVAIAAKKELDPRIDRVTDRQLVELSDKLGVDHITLLARTDDDIVAMRSSDPAEINLSTKTWDYWYTAFNQLFDRHHVTIPQGQKLEYYWSGPIQYSSSNPNRIDKWGYYYDGTTDYIINPYIDAKDLLEYADQHGTNALIRELRRDNPDIAGIAGFDPEFFGKPPILKNKKGVLVYNLDVRDIAFGEYTYGDLSDAANVRQSAATGQMVTTTGYVNGQHVLKSFIPLGGAVPYVVGISFDYAVIDRALQRELRTHLVISLILIAAGWLLSYVIAGRLIRPLRQIVRHVNEMAGGRFGGKIEVSTDDEFGLLSSRINTMAENLQSYMGRLVDTAQELRGTKAYLESFVNHTSDAIHVTDLEGRIIRVNKAFEKIYGWTEEETRNKPLPNIPDNQHSTYVEDRERIKLGDSLTDYETVRVTKNGNLIDVSLTVSPIRSEAGDVVAIAVISRDITARKQTEEMIRRSEKLSIVGQLAAGVAHEIRNPLTTLRGFVQLQQQQGPLSGEHLNLMLSELDRINLIVSEFLVLAKPQAQQYQEADVRPILQDMILLLDSQGILSNVTFETRFESDLPPIVCEVNQLKQVFLNVVKNGMEAMPAGGTIRVDALHLPEERSVLVRIRDEGCGIHAEDLPRLGEPFFTNKESGTGLGLMVSQRIIENHKGSLKIDSKLGEGTCVEIRLPTEAA